MQVVVGGGGCLPATQPVATVGCSTRSRRRLLLVLQPRHGSRLVVTCKAHRRTRRRRRGRGRPDATTMEPWRPPQSHIKVLHLQRIHGCHLWVPGPWPVQRSRHPPPRRSGQVRPGSSARSRWMAHVRRDLSLQSKMSLIHGVFASAVCAVIAPVPGCWIPSVGRESKGDMRLHPPVRNPAGHRRRPCRRPSVPCHATIRHARWGGRRNR